VTTIDYTANRYRYRPEDFRDMTSLADDLTDFYRMLDIRNAEETESTHLDLEVFWCENLFFTIKQCEVMGRLAPYTAAEIREYLEGLLYAD
jgi:hypothetical protein